jgi:hypothetical protein
VDGHLETPWGSLPPEVADAPGLPAGGTVTVVLRASGLVAAGEGPVRGMVTSRRFGGDHVLYSVAVPGAPILQVEARGGEWPAVGQTVALQVLAGGVHVIRGEHVAPEAVAPEAAAPEAAAPEAVPPSAPRRPGAAAPTDEP